MYKLSQEDKHTFPESRKEKYKDDISFSIFFLFFASVGVDNLQLLNIHEKIYKRTPPTFQKNSTKKLQNLVLKIVSFPFRPTPLGGGHLLPLF